MANPTAYPATEAAIGNASEWSLIKRPIIPTMAFGEGSLDQEMIDVIEVGDDGLVVLENGDETYTPSGDLADDREGEGDAEDRQQEQE